MLSLPFKILKFDRFLRIYFYYLNEIQCSILLDQERNFIPSFTVSFPGQFSQRKTNLIKWNLKAWEVGRTP